VPTSATALESNFALYQPPWKLTHRKQGKAFFFEKKKQYSDS
jgi:hypothetical protein